MWNIILLQTNLAESKKQPPEESKMALDKQQTGGQSNLT